MNISYGWLQERRLVMRKAGMRLYCRGAANVSRPAAGTGLAMQLHLARKVRLPAEAPAGGHFMQAHRLQTSFEQDARP